MSKFPLLHLPELHNVLMTALKLGSRYRLGAKFKSVLDAFPKGQEVDCSGFFRWVLIHASQRSIAVPDGSWMQRLWCEGRGFEKVNYTDVMNAKDNRVYAAFILPRGPIAGHVWILRNGVTWESFSGKGIGNRKGNHLTLRLQVHSCFRIA